MLKFILEKLINSFNEKYDDDYHYWYEALALRSALHSWNRGSQVGSVMWPRCDCHSCEEFHRKSVQRWVLDSAIIRMISWPAGTVIIAQVRCCLCWSSRINASGRESWANELFFSASVGPNCHSVPPQHRCAAVSCQRGRNVITNLHLVIWLLWGAAVCASHLYLLLHSSFIESIFQLFIKRNE